MQYFSFQSSGNSSKYIKQLLCCNHLLLQLTKCRHHSVQSLSHVRLFVTPWTAAHQASLSITNSRSLLKLMSIESVMPFNHAILCHPFWLHSINFSSLQPAVIITLPCSVVFLCCCSVTKLYPPLCDPMNCSMPGFSVHHYLPECSNLCPLSQ